MAKRKAVKKTVMVGRGVFDTLKKHAGTALNVAGALGFKPSDLLSKVSQNKSGIFGTLGRLGSDVLAQKGYGRIKAGTRLGCNEMVGSGFFGDLWSGIKSFGKKAAPFITPLTMALAPEFTPLAMAGTQALQGSGPSSYNSMRGGCGVGYANAASMPSNVRSLKLT